MQSPFSNSMEELWTISNQVPVMSEGDLRETEGQLPQVNEPVAKEHIRRRGIRDFIIYR